MRSIVCGAGIVAMSGVCAFTSFGQKREETVIELGGLRHVKAKLHSASNEYRITVEMLPVSCFDAATNNQLNRDKAKMYGLQALAKHLSDKPKIQMVVSGVEIVGKSSDAKFFTLTLRVPKDGIRLEESDNKPALKQSAEDKNKAERILLSPELLTRKQEYIDTMNRLTNEIMTASEALDKLPLETEENMRQVLIAIADLEEKSESNLAKLLQECDSDLLLLTVEKRDLIKETKIHHDKVLLRLKEAVRKTEPKSEKGKSL